VKSLIGVVLAISWAGSCLACSVLSHEAIVDAAWLTRLEPLLRAKFPEASPEELKASHGYAYGGAIIQDLGYYPHGNKHFSDLTHYVWAGDFVIALIAEAHDLNELAFALGALSHYSSDSEVHRYATNPGEAMLYPQLERKFGKVITYEQDPAAHLKTEFAFDVLEVAKANFAPEAYHDFIGFGVSAPLLERAFRRTYGLELSDLFPDLARSLGSYRRAVSKTIPAATRMAWAQREDDIKREQPGITHSKFVYFMSRSSYEQEWGRQYDRPTIRDRIAAVLLKLIPPIGPLRNIRLKMPDARVEKLFLRSFDKSMIEYDAQLDRFRTLNLELPNINYDLGEVAKPGEYALQDATYVFWLHELAKKKFETSSPAMRQELLGYFQTAPGLLPAKSKQQGFQFADDLSQLKELGSKAPAARYNDPRLSSVSR
jgi:Zinc dependent phospholipase C